MRNTPFVPIKFTLPSAAILVSLLAVPGFCLQDTKNSPTTVNASTSTYSASTSKSNSNVVSTATLTTEERFERLREKLPEITVQETVINVSPKMRIYLPSGAFDMALKQQYRKTAMEFTSKYDFVDSFMGFGLDFAYAARRLSPGLSLTDTIDFNEVYSGDDYIQRSQALTPYTVYPLSDKLRLKASMKFENTYTSSVSSNTSLDRGRNILGEIGLWSDTVIESTSSPRGGTYSFTVQNSFENLGSDYHYTQIELNVMRYFSVFKTHFIEYALQAGYPVEVSNRPLNSFYYAGGYKVLRGYKFKEFTGDSIIYSTVKYNVPLSNPKEEDYFKHISVSMFTWDIFADMAKIGSKDIYTLPIEAKASIGTGFGYKIVLFRLFPVKLELSAAKALEDRPVYYYFTVSTIYYTWRN